MSPLQRIGIDRGTGSTPIFLDIRTPRSRGRDAWPSTFAPSHGLGSSLRSAPVGLPSGLQGTPHPPWRMWHEFGVRLRPILQVLGARDARRGGLRGWRGENAVLQ